MAVYSDLNLNVGQVSNAPLIFDVSAINASISNIINTVPGERILLPEFGSRIIDFLQEPIIEETADLIRTHLILAIERWETRIQIDLRRSSVIPNSAASMYDVILFYTILNINVEGTYENPIQVRGA